MKKNIQYKDLMIGAFAVLLDIYDVETAIVILYEINKCRGRKI